jgi:hypothetical protein
VLPEVIVLLAAITIALLFLVARRSASHVARTASGPDFASEPLDWLKGSPLAGRLGDARPVATGDGWQSLAVSDLTVAEELLDHIERAGITEAELVMKGESTFEVRWRAER